MPPVLALQGLMRHTLGRGWRRQSAAAVLGAGTPPEIMHLLRLMHDTGDASAPLSVHNLCAAQGVPGCASQHESATPTSGGRRCPIKQSIGMQSIKHSHILNTRFHCAAIVCVEFRTVVVCSYLRFRYNCRRYDLTRWQFCVEGEDLPS